MYVLYICIHEIYLQSDFMEMFPARNYEKNQPGIPVNGAWDAPVKDHGASSNQKQFTSHVSQLMYLICIYTL